jgi:hypothetical protein
MPFGIIAESRSASPESPAYLLDFPLAGFCWAL